jgi:hypothetical protein
MSINFLSLSLDGLPICSVSNTEPVSRISQQVYELHCDEVQVFMGIFQQIAPALNQCIYCLLKTHIQQEKHIPQLKEP